jgi:isopentenyl-diphosphate delta-isomerase
MSIQEHVILVNDQGMVIGTQEKYAAHTLHTPLHLAFSSWLFNAKGECLITRRALSKKPGPASGPTPSAATRSRAKRQSRR